MEATPLARTPRPRSFLDTRRLVLFGYLSPFILYLAPMSARFAFGGVTLEYFTSDFVLTLGSFAFMFTCLLRVHHWSVRRRHSTVRKTAIAYVTCILVCAATSLARYLLRTSFPALIPPDPHEGQTLSFVVATAFSDSMLLMAYWGAIFLFPLTLRRAQKQLRQVVVARREAEILRLRAHLEPHFVLNTLNAIAGLVVDDPVEARRMIGLLGDLFRDATSDRADDMHSLSDEVAWLERYAAIHESRHRRMVRFEWDVDEAAGATRIPRLVLQPLVENAVLHGILRRRQGGTVKVRARIEGKMLVCDVEDDGIGFPLGPRRAGSQGLRMVERRLSLFSRNATLTIASADGATCVSARFPIDDVRR